MPTALVLGGAGFYGARVSSTLAERGFDVHVGSRRSGKVRVDLLDPSTFSALEGWDVVVNCTDSVNAPPDDALAHVVSSGGRWVEMGADANTASRLLSTPHDDGPGLAIVGAGIFPGLSTLLAGSVLGEAEDPESLELVVRFSPLSGAGRGNCALMAESLFEPAREWRRGESFTHRTSLGGSSRFALPHGDHVAVMATLPDTDLIHRLAPNASVSTWFALEPSWLRFNFGVLAWFAWALSWMRGLVVAVMTLQLQLVRAHLLRRRETSVELTVFADRASASPTRRSLLYDDGQLATAQAAAAACEAMLDADAIQPGVHALADLFTLDEITSRMPARG